MNRLVAEIAEYISIRMRSAALALQDDGTLRSVFHGPPLRFLSPLLQLFMEEGGIEVTLKSGKPETIPVLLPVERPPAGQENPPVGKSGPCDESHILALRNTPACPRFLTIAAPARHSILSVAQATDEFGMSPDNNGGSARIEEWLKDEFVQYLITAALARHLWKSESHSHQAKKLLEHAIRAADEVDRHDPQRPHAWATISRVLSISAKTLPFPSEWSLACGFPPLEDGTLDADEQIRVLKALTERIADVGFTSSSTSLEENAGEEEGKAVHDCLHHLQAVCDVPTALTRSAPFYYAPSNDDVVGDPPSWWQVLTVERLTELLEEEGAPTGALEISCTNAILQTGRGLQAVVRDRAELTFALPDDVTGPVDAMVSREIGARLNRREWDVRMPSDEQLTDSEIPAHRRPVRYSIQASGLKKASLRLVSLAHWEPGVIVSCRSATKLTLPKKARAGSGVDLECSLVVAGEGRHYLDLYVAPGVTVGDRATGEDASGSGAEAVSANISQVEDGTYGLEVIASAECNYDIPFADATGAPRVIRVQLSCDDLPSEGCSSEFERLIRLNGAQNRVRAAAEVQVDRQVRVADLQGWLLDPATIGKSFYPLVLAPDCRDAWKQPSWNSSSETVMSKGNFLHDPRPSMDELTPPAEFLRAREAIARRIRGDDGHGLVEAAQFGIWMKEPEFASDVDLYVRSYFRWLDAEPDVAAWADISIVCNLENDRRTLTQEPDAVLVSPMHALRIAWHCLAQGALWDAHRIARPCPAASVLDPDAVPDLLVLPLRTPNGSVKRLPMLSTECSSDYWSVLWNGNRLSRLGARGELLPFDKEFGIQLGGVSSGFSVSQVGRSLNDVADLLSAKPILNVVVSSSSGHSDACNEGLTSWALNRFSEKENQSEESVALGLRFVNVFDERAPESHPEETAVANLAEDTVGAVRWFNGTPTGSKPDLGIVAQLETANANTEQTDLGSPLGIGALFRHRVRTQLRAGSGAFLCESRMGVVRPPSGDGLADNLMAAVARLENLGDVRYGYTFAPSVQAITYLFRSKNTEYVAVSSSAVDPACFLGGWLDGFYLWDYELPSYSHRAGDTNGYYLLSQVRPLDCDKLRELLARLPGCDKLDDESVQDILLEVARRGMPTVRGLSASHSGAAGDLGLFLAGRLLQDEFRRSHVGQSILPVMGSDGEVQEIALVIPVDPFRWHLQDLQRSLGPGQFLRPDLVVAGITVSDSAVHCRITPIEVKYRREEVMSESSCLSALEQAQSLSLLMEALRERAEAEDMMLWKIAFQHLLISILDFGFRVYSQQDMASRNPSDWSRLHQKVIASVLAEEIQVEIDETGRLIVFDGSATSSPRDADSDGRTETIVVSAVDAANIVRDEPAALYESVRAAVGDWRLYPQKGFRAKPMPQTSPVPELPSAPVVSSANVVGIDDELTYDVDVRESFINEPTLEATLEASPADELFAPEATPVVEPPTTKPPAPAAVISGTQPSNQGLSILVGQGVDGFKSESKYLCPSKTALNNLNMGVVGDLGTGKTQLLKSIVYQMTTGAEKNAGVAPRFLIFDYKLDYSSSDFVSAVGAQVVKPQHLPLNLFDVSAVSGETLPWLGRFKFFADVLDKIYSGVGAVQRENLKQAVREAYEGATAMGRQPTIYDVHDRYRANRQGRADSPLGIIGDMVDMEIFTRDPAGTVAFDEFLNGVVVLSLDALGQDDHAKNAVVAIMLNMFYEHMLRIPKRPYFGEDPQLRVVDSYLLVDEADNIMRYEFDVLRKVLLQGREFGVGVILASQFLRHFKAGATDYREPLLSWFIHKVPNVTTHELSALGLTGNATQMTDRIRQLANHQCLFKTFDVPGEIVQGVPFYKLIEQERR